MISDLGVVSKRANEKSTGCCHPVLLAEYPPPGTGQRLVQDGVAGAGVRGDNRGGRTASVRIGVDHAIFVRAEQADASLVVAQRSRTRRVGRVQAAGASYARGREGVTALTGTSRVTVIRQGAVNQASRERAHGSGAHIDASARSKVGQRHRVAD